MNNPWLAIAEPAPSGFEFRRELVSRDLRRAAFALFAESVEQAEAALQPFRGKVFGLIVTRKATSTWEDRGDGIYHLGLPSQLEPHLQDLLRPLLATLQRILELADANSQRSRDLTRAAEDRARLVHEFSNMRDSLLKEIEERRVAQEALQKAHDELEVRVRERTAALAKANEGLEAEIAQRKRAQEEIQRARQAAERANRAKSEFLSNMSHELRTPLNSVIGFSNILLKNKADNLNPADLDFLERIRSNGMHLLGLINQVLDLSKVEAGKIELEWTQVSLARMVPDILAQFESQVRGRDVKLVGEVPPEMLPVRADEVRLKQIVINLVGNALKFTQDGSVTLRVSRDPETHQPRRIDVVDTGIGIPADKLDRIFEAFEQADVSTTRKYGGTGLGLTISRALCKLMGFDLVVRSKPGKGTTFSIQIPAQAQKESAPAPPSLPPLPAEPKPLSRIVAVQHKLVMIIDDELDARLLLSRLVEECGCRVITADSGEAGLHLAREVHPDLILLDLMMPKMNGWQVLDALKADPATSRIPVAVASVVAAENRGTLLGTLDCLQKPISGEAILRMLRRLPHSKVLVVDDSEADRLLMKTALEADGVEVRTAVNGREALEVLPHFFPDLVVLDLMMPEMDGFTFLEELRKEPRYEHLPVVIVTAKDLTAEDRERINHHAQAILKKADDLATDLKRLLES